MLQNFEQNSAPKRPYMALDCVQEIQPSSPWARFPLSGVVSAPGAILHPPNLTQKTPWGYRRCPPRSRAEDPGLSSIFEALDFFFFLKPDYKQ